MIDSKMDISIITETNITEYYNKYLLGYNILDTKSTIHRRGLSFLYRTHSQKWLSNYKGIWGNFRIIKTNGKIRPHKNILIGEINKIIWGKRDRYILISSYLLIWGLHINLEDHSHLRKLLRRKDTWKSADGSTWSQCDYIIITNREEWVIFQYKVPRYLSLDHYMVIGSLKYHQRLKINSISKQELPIT